MWPGEGLLLEQGRMTRGCMQWVMMTNKSKSGLLRGVLLRASSKGNRFWPDLVILVCFLALEKQRQEDYKFQASLESCKATEENPAT